MWAVTGHQAHTSDSALYAPRGLEISVSAVRPLMGRLACESGERAGTTVGLASGIPNRTIKGTRDLNDCQPDLHVGESSLCGVCSCEGVPGGLVFFFEDL